MSIIRFMNHVFGFGDLNMSASYALYGFMGFTFMSIIAINVIRYRQRTNFENSLIVVACEIGTAWGSIITMIFTSVNFFHAIK